jgi:hypothetical protein
VVPAQRHFLVPHQWPFLDGAHLGQQSRKP